MKRFLPGKQLETLTVCGVQKALFNDPQDRLSQTSKSLKQMSKLDSTLRSMGTSITELAPGSRHKPKLKCPVALQPCFRVSGPVAARALRSLLARHTMTQRTRPHWGSSEAYNQLLLHRTTLTAHSGQRVHATDATVQTKVTSGATFLTHDRQVLHAQNERTSVRSARSPRDSDPHKY
jgi:hypothetical protein